ncbi:hypothetical protein LXL04_033086 [Taraxacum kok-saghyz]
MQPRIIEFKRNRTKDNKTMIKVKSGKHRNHGIVPFVNKTPARHEPVNLAKALTFITHSGESPSTHIEISEAPIHDELIKHIHTRDTHPFRESVFLSTNIIEIPHQ